MEKTIIALPNGEWWDSLEEAFRVADVPLVRATKRNYRIELPTADITGIMTRTKDIAEIVDDPSSKAVAGITGSDMLVNAGRRQVNQNSSSDPVIPLRTLVPTAPQPKIYLATTPNAPVNREGVISLRAILEGVHRNSISSNPKTVARNSGLQRIIDCNVSRKN